MLGAGKPRVKGKIIAQFIHWLARFLATTGGLVLVLLIAITCLSILGRSANTVAHSVFLTNYFPQAASCLLSLGVGPLLGDFELVEVGVAFAIFAFLPICQLHSNHATVDIVTGMLPPRIKHFLIVFWEIVLTAIIMLISWRLGVGMMDKFGNGQTSFLLQFPIWWGYALSFIASLGAVIVALYCAFARVRWFITGHNSLPEARGEMQ